MEPLDRELAKALGDQPPARGPARILVVGGDHRCLSELVPALETREHPAPQLRIDGAPRQPRLAAPGREGIGGP